MNYIDFLIIGITLLFILTSARKGLMTLVVEIVGYLVSVPISLHFSGIWAEPFYNKFVNDRLVTAVGEKLSTYSSPEEITNAINNFTSNLPFSLEDLSEAINYDVSGTLNSFLANVNTTNYTQLLVDNILKPVCIYICTGVLFVLILIIFLAFVRLFARLLNKIKLPKVLKSTNSVFGGVVGLLKACIIIVVFATVTNFFCTAFDYKENTNKFIQATNQSKIVQFVNERNPLLKT